jgi:hypothetical protein
VCTRASAAAASEVGGHGTCRPYGRGTSLGPGGCGFGDESAAGEPLELASGGDMLWDGPAWVGRVWGQVLELSLPPKQATAENRKQQRAEGGAPSTHAVTAHQQRRQQGHQRRRSGPNGHIERCGPQRSDLGGSQPVQGRAFARAERKRGKAAAADHARVRADDGSGVVQ